MSTTAVRATTAATYTVQRGDSLAALAQRFLGSSASWPLLAQANGISDPSQLRVGQVLRIPQQSYVVQRGDTLSSIAKSMLGDANRWRELAELNQINSPQDLRIGMSLKIPVGPAPGPVVIPVAPTPVKPQPPSFREYTVQRGDTLSSIAQQLLGNGNRWREIADLNRIAKPQDLRVGMVLKIPTAGAPQSPAPSTPPVAPKPSVPVTPKPTQPPSPNPVARTYTVQAGDTLSRIADKTLGNPQRWPEIARLNNITQPQQLRVGMVLQLPADGRPAQPTQPIQPTVPPTAPVKPTPVQPPTVSPSVPGQYTVRAGDTLSSIARTQLGNAQRWEEIARLNGIQPPYGLRVGQVLRLPQGDESRGLVDVAVVINGPKGKQLPAKGKVKIETRGDKIFALWQKLDLQDQIGVIYEAGLYRRGLFRPRDFITENRELLAKLMISDSEMRAIAATSENEGYLDAINTWDSQFLSFGMFQWTAGSPNSPGELGGLLTRLQMTYPDEFSHYFSQFGLGVEGSDGVRGWLTLNGNRLSTEAQKQVLREPVWAYRFALAGQDLLVQSVEVRQAVARIDSFYFARQKALDGLMLSQLITSEYGVALLLDNHVNRPAYVAPCVAEALWRVGLTSTQMVQGSPSDEERVLNAYLSIRQTYGSKPMTHAKQRGDRITRLAQQGILDVKRGSFQSNRMLRSR